MRSWSCQLSNDADISPQIDNYFPVVASLVHGLYLVKILELESTFGCGLGHTLSEGQFTSLDISISTSASCHVADQSADQSTRTKF